MIRRGSLVRTQPDPPKRFFGLLGTRRGCSSAGRAAALQAVGRRFDPDQLHQKAREKKGTRSKTCRWQRMVRCRHVLLLAWQLRLLVFEVCSLKNWKKCSTYRAGAYCKLCDCIDSRLSLSAQALNRTNEFVLWPVLLGGTKVIGSSD